MRRPATVTVTPRPTRRDVADIPAATTGSRFKVLGALLHNRNFATASRLESDPFPPSRSGGVHRDPLGPLSQNRPRPSGWELESQIWGPP